VKQCLGCSNVVWTAVGALRSAVSLVVLEVRAIGCSSYGVQRQLVSSHGPHTVTVHGAAAAVCWLPYMQTPHLHAPVSTLCCSGNVIGKSCNDCRCALVQMHMMKRHSLRGPQPFGSL
jgi:hypothetical protein